jgi:hypothetical protein
MDTHSSLEAKHRNSRMHPTCPTTAFAQHFRGSPDMNTTQLGLNSLLVDPWIQHAEVI